LKKICGQPRLQQAGSFMAENDSSVPGTNDDQTIVGTTGNDSLTGGYGSDTIIPVLVTTSYLATVRCLGRGCILYTRGTLLLTQGKLLTLKAVPCLIKGS
jgi:Ca2+-binding RTX toxin-like protein